MRYTNARKYPITQKKKTVQPGEPNRIIDLSVGAAAGLLGMIFLEGIFCGYLIRGRHK